jgi:hypothetical protein
VTHELLTFTLVKARSCPRQDVEQLAPCKIQRWGEPLEEANGAIFYSSTLFCLRVRQRTDRRRSEHGNLSHELVLKINRKLGLKYFLQRREARSGTVQRSQHTLAATGTAGHAVYKGDEKQRRERKMEKQLARSRARGKVAKSRQPGDVMLEGALAFAVASLGLWKRCADSDLADGSGSGSAPAPGDEEDGEAAAAVGEGETAPAGGGRYACQPRI